MQLAIAAASWGTVPLLSLWSFAFASEADESVPNIPPLFFQKL
jgi:hypothetical protein